MPSSLPLAASAHAGKPSGRGWKDGRGKWQPLPEWATEDSEGDGGRGDKSRGGEGSESAMVGTFDSSGHFSIIEEVCGCVSEWIY